MPLLKKWRQKKQKKWRQKNGVKKMASKKFFLKVSRCFDDTFFKSGVTHK